MTIMIEAKGPKKVTFRELVYGLISMVEGPKD
jgi:hypothetical protein